MAVTGFRIKSMTRGVNNRPETMNMRTCTRGTRRNYDWWQRIGKYCPTRKSEEVPAVPEGLLLHQISSAQAGKMPVVVGCVLDDRAHVMTSVSKVSCGQVRCAKRRVEIA